MSKLPADYDETLWLSPYQFFGLVGRPLAHTGVYTQLFRQDGFAKPRVELMQIPAIRALIEEP